MKRLIITFVAIFPLGLVWGFIKGVDFNREPASAELSLQGRASAVFSRESFELRFRDVPRGLESWTTHYSGIEVPSPEIGSKLADTSFPFAGVLEYTFFAVHAVVVKAAEKATPTVVWRPVPAFLGSVLGYTPGRVAAMALRTGEIDETIARTARTGAFRDDLANRFYRRAASAIIAAHDGQSAPEPTMARLAELRAFAKAERLTEADRRKIHPTIYLMASSPAVRRALEPRAPPAMVAIVLVCAASLFAWIACLRRFLAMLRATRKGAL